MGFVGLGDTLSVFLVANALPLGSPKSTSSLFSWGSETWNITELWRIKLRVATTAFI